MSNKEWYYSADECAERLTAQSVYDAVIEAVDGWPEPPGYNDTIEITEFRPMELPSRDVIADRVLEHICEWLDEEYGDPDSDSETPTESLRNEALEFADAVRSEYRVFACEPKETFTVLVREYVPEEWIAGGSAQAAQRGEERE